MDRLSRTARGKDDVWRKRRQFDPRICAYRPYCPRPAIVELDVLPGSSSQLLQSLQESRIADLRLRIVRDVEHEETDAAHALGLLRPRRQRPSGRRAAEKGDELAALDLRAHSITSSARASSDGLIR